MESAARTHNSRMGSSRAFWLKQLHQWHWISSALCLVGMLLFAVTGFTLNHAGQIEAHASTVHRSAQLPAPLLKAVAGEDERKNVALPAAVADWAAATLDVDVSGRTGDWSSDEIYIAMPRPGGDAWLSIDRETGKVETERSTRGVIAYLNDLHKGRNAGPAWGWFIDVFALACVIFAVVPGPSVTLIVANSLTPWPLVAFGLVLPLLLALLFIH